MKPLPDWLRNPLEQWERTWHNHVMEAPVTHQQMTDAVRQSLDRETTRDIYPVRDRPVVLKPVTPPKGDD